MKRLRRPRRLYLTGLLGFALVAAANGPIVSQFATSEIHEYEISRPAYQAKYGSWRVLELPGHFRVNAVHTALLQTGKLLIIAGSGNDQQNFDKGTFKTLLWDPQSNTMKLIPTPTDLFCGGHAFLPDGKLLVAGGTQQYEVLKSTISNAGGGVMIKNESPNGSRTFPKHTKLMAPNGQAYQTDIPLTVPPAAKKIGPQHRVRVTASETEVWVNAVAKGKIGEIDAPTKFQIEGLAGRDAHNLYALGSKMSLEKQDFQGTDVAFVFDPIAERYDFVPPMPHKRWYPSLATLNDGRILAVSGLNGTGEIVSGDTDVFDPKSMTWSKGPFRYFPTYPALFPTAHGKLFYTGSNVGYGPAEKGRQPGVWDPKRNTFTPIPGLPDPVENETSGSVLLPPAQAQKFMFLGGGSVAESPLVTARTAVVDLNSPKPRYVRGPNLAEPTRYPLSVILPDDTVLVTGGSREYRGSHSSDNHTARIYHPTSNTFATAASPKVGRDYHSEAVLLPDGRVMTLGSNPLFGNKEDSSPGFFEQRMEVYSPPYLFKGSRPRITGGATLVKRGGEAGFTTSDPAKIAKVRLIHPSAATHDTDLEQRSVALRFKRTATGVSVMIPKQRGLVPLGWYMLFVDNARGVPSIARWVQVT